MTASAMPFRVPVLVLFSGLLFGALGLTSAVLSQPAPPQSAPTPWARMVDGALHPLQPSLDLAGGPQPLAAAVDDRGEQTDFIVGRLLIRPESDAQLAAFLARFGGRVVGSNAIDPAPLGASGREPAAQGRRPTSYAIALDLTRADLSNLPERHRAIGLSAAMRFSSEAGLRTHALLLDARREGYRVKPDFAVYPQQMGFRPGASATFPQTLFASRECQSGPPCANFAYDAFTEAHFGAGNDGAFANVIPAWQFLAAHGIKRRVRLTVIDSGFWVNLPDTPPQAIDSDIPLNVPQWDRINGDANVNRQSRVSCSGGNACPYHGTGVAGVAAGIANNGMGRMGTGALVADLALIRYSGSSGDLDSALRQAVRDGADVIVMSFGYRCNAWCLAYGDDSDFSELVEDGTRAVALAAAGNEGRQVDKEGAMSRPCTEAYIFCVGALTDGALTRGIFGNGLASSYGQRVDIFAPTNIPTMSYPDLGGTVSRANPSFGGTSAATPFVGGVAAMIKAINPDLGPVEVGNILRATARPGTVPDVTRSLDALAAVRLAAQGIPIVKDRFEGAGVVDFGTAANRTEGDLNLDAADSDVFRFTATQASDATITLRYPKDLGAVSINPLIDEIEGCRPSTLTATALPPPPAGSSVNAYRQERSYTYRVAAGGHRIVARADDVNGYEITLAVAPASVAPDAFEANQDFAHARLFGYWPGGWTERGAQATIHTGAVPDVDVYLVRGVAGPIHGGSGMGYVLNVFPGVQVTGYESAITLEVYKQLPDGSPDLASKITRSGNGCDAKALTVSLQDGQYYYVVVKGAPGRYALYNGGVMDFHRLNYIDLERFPKKPGPVEIGSLKYLAIEADPGIAAITLPGQQFQLALIDPATGNRLREARLTRTGLRLDLQGAIAPGQAAVVEVRRRARIGIGDAATGAVAFAPRLEQARALRASANLIAGGDADTLGANRGILAPWTAARGGPAALLATAGLPDSIVRGSGRYVFGPGRAAETGLRQTVRFGRDWLEAIGAGRVKASLTARLGGTNNGAGVALGRMTFLDSNGRELGAAPALSVGVREREGPAMLDAASDSVVPAGAVAARIDLVLQRGRTNGEPMADDLSLTLTEFVQ